MIAAADIYDALHAVSDSSFHLDVQVNHTYDSYENHLFIVYGHISGSSEENTFQEFASFVDEYEPDEVTIGSAVKGGHIKFRFDADRVSGEPEKQSDYDRILPREAEVGTVRECTNCRASTYGLHRPPITIRYPSDTFKSATEEVHDLCVDCSPGHFDDVTRRVEYFGIEDGVVSIVAFDNADGVEEFEYSEVDNPYVEDVVGVINRYILDS